MPLLASPPQRFAGLTTVVLATAAAVVVGLFASSGGDPAPAPWVVVLVALLGVVLGLSAAFLFFSARLASAARTLTQAAGIAPDGDPVAANYQQLLANNMLHWKNLKDTLNGVGIGYLYEYNVDAYAPGTIAPCCRISSPRR